MSKFGVSPLRSGRRSPDRAARLFGVTRPSLASRSSLAPTSVPDRSVTY